MGYLSRSQQFSLPLLQQQDVNIQGAWDFAVIDNYKNEGRTPVPEKEKMRELAGHNTSMAVFLSSGLTKELQDELLTGGYSEDTPCAICYKVSWPDEKIIMTTIKNLHNDMVSNSIAKTALILVGDFLGRKYNNSKLYDASFTTEYRK